MQSYAIAQQWLHPLNFSSGSFQIGQTYHRCQQTNKESAPVASTRQLQPQEQFNCWWILEIWQSKSPLSHLSAWMKLLWSFRKKQYEKKGAAKLN